MQKTARQAIHYSIVVCSYNGSSTIRECLAALMDQTLPTDEYEIVVVDDGSTDGLAEAVLDAFGSRPNCRLIQFAQNRGLSAARNVGWQAARGEIVLYIDDDAVADPDWVQRITQAYGSQTAGVGGLMRSYQHSPFASYEMGLQVLEYGAKAERLDGAGGNNMSFRRSVLQEVGGFDERFTAVADDADINRRLVAAGKRLLVLPDLTVRHRTPTTHRQFWKKKVGRGKGSQVFREKYGLPGSSARHLVKMIFRACFLPEHLILGYRVGLAAGKPRDFWRFAVLSWLDRVGTAYGELMQSTSSAT